MNKLFILFIVVATLGFSFTIMPSEANDIDTSSFAITCYPTTLGSSGWITINITNKQIDAINDIVFGFGDVGKITKLQIWENYSHPIRNLVNETVTNTVGKNMTKTEVSNWVWTNETYWDWRDILGGSTEKKAFEVVSNWQSYKSLLMENQKVYTYRAYVDIPFSGFKTIQGEYYIGIKNSNKTLTQAINDKSFTSLDPWYNVAWTKRAFITVNEGYQEGITMTGVPVAVNVSAAITADCLPFGEDVRFVALDNTTLYDYEIERWTTGGAGYCWVNITTFSLGIGFWMYYKNPAASASQDSTKVWDQYYSGVYHMNDTSVIWDSTSNRRKSTATTGTPVTKTNAVFGNCTWLNGASYYSMGNVHDVGGSALTFEVIGNITNSNTYPVWIRKCEDASTIGGYVFYQYANANPGERCQFADNGGNTYQPPISGNYYTLPWTYLTVSRAGQDSATLTGLLFNRGTDSLDIGDATGAYNFYVGKDCFGIGTASEGRFDEIRITIGIQRNSTWQNWTWNNLNKTDSLNWSASENAPVPTYPELVTLGSITNHTTDVCPCCDELCITVTMSNGSSFNVSIYMRVNNTVSYWTLDAVSNLTANATYCVCICSHAMWYNTTYQWYYNVSKNGNSSIYNQSGIYEFTTAEEPSDCSSSASATTVSGGSIGIVGLIGLFGWILGNRRRRNRF